MMKSDRRALSLVVAAALALGTAACGSNDGGGESADASDTGAVRVEGATTVANDDVEAANEAGARRFVEEVFNKRNTAAIDEFIAPDFVDHTPGPGQEQGLAGFKKMMAEMGTGMSDMKVEVLDVLTKGDLVVMHVRQTGTNTGPMMGMPATNKPFDIRGVDIVRIRDGKAVEHWGYVEESKMMQQLGLMPAPGTPPMGAPPAGGSAPSATPADTAKAP